MRYLPAITVFFLLGGCQWIQPKEVAATVFKYRYMLACTCCGGLEVRIGSDKYRTKEGPPPFATDTVPVMVDSLPVWIRYRDDDNECGRIMRNMIVITSMRLR
ncbi:hypothetical protein [Spirosoma terrae]|uniref:Uncharacterized protein n=1 Tax=Spirosoma terrae TaxID=1968276 RepID=A0A6L9LG78_9BACT|nr:hypothetical protein [Spirosoma terrae]NDU98181.1 hypothetical protein [Spirosoma terrae]